MADGVWLGRFFWGLGARCQVIISSRRAVYWFLKGPVCFLSTDERAHITALAVLEKHQHSKLLTHSASPNAAGRLKNARASSGFLTELASQRMPSRKRDCARALRAASPPSRRGRLVEIEHFPRSALQQTCPLL
jgi:hypothetical protein